MSIKLSDISLWHWLVGVTMSLLGAAPFVWRYIHCRWRFAMNLRRTVYFFQTSEDRDMQAEKDKITQLKIFKVDDQIRSLRSDTTNRTLQSLHDKAVYVVGFNEDYNFANFFKYRGNRKIPIIIYAKAGEIPRNSRHWDTFNDDIYCDIANTPNRIALVLMSMFEIT